MRFEDFAGGMIAVSREVVDAKQVELTRLLNLSSGAMSQVEGGIKGLRAEKLLMALDYLGVDLNWFWKEWSIHKYT